MIKKIIVDFINKNKNNIIINNILMFFGYGEAWLRIIPNKDLVEYIDTLDSKLLDVAEISGTHLKGYDWNSYECLSYPEFDICNPYIGNKKYDLIICEHVLEHVPSPWDAVENMYKMLNNGGTLIVSTPFLIKIHPCPNDYWRFTPDGMKVLLESKGFEIESVKSWGSRACVKANLSNDGKWANYNMFRSLKNESLFPVTVWAYAKKNNSI